MGRGIIFAALACLLTSQSEHRATAQVPAVNKAGADPASLPRAERQLPSPQEYQPVCERPKSREDSELCAQWGVVAIGRRANALAAEANKIARQTNSAEIMSLLWTQLGLFLVFISTTVSAWAAFAASRAAKAAREAVEGFRLVERPILYPTSITLSGFRQGGRIDGFVQIKSSYCLENVGRGPLWLEEYSVALMVCPELTESPEYGPHISAGGRIILPGEPYKLSQKHKEIDLLTPGAVLDFLEGRTRVFVVGYTRYRDSFGGVWTTRFGREAELGHPDGDLYPVTKDISVAAYWQENRDNVAGGRIKHGKKPLFGRLPFRRG